MSIVVIEPLFECFEDKMRRNPNPDCLDEFWRSRKGKWITENGLRRCCDVRIHHDSLTYLSRGVIVITFDDEKLATVYNLLRDSD